MVPPYISGAYIPPPQGQFGVSQNIPYGNPYTANSGLIVQRGCGKYPGIYEVGDEECRVVTLPGTSTRATVCNCRSDSCNSRRPDQVQNPLTNQQTLPVAGFYPNAPPSSTGGGYNPSLQGGSVGQFQPGYQPGYNNQPVGPYGVYSPQPGYQQPYGQPGTGFYPGQQQQQPGAQYPYQPNINTAYGPQPGGYVNAPVGQPNYPGYAVPAGQFGGAPLPPYSSDPYAYNQGRYNGHGQILQRPWALCLSTLMLVAVAANLFR